MRSTVLSKSQTTSEHGGPDGGPASHSSIKPESWIGLLLALWPVAGVAASWSSGSGCGLLLPGLLSGGTIGGIMGGILNCRGGGGRAAPSASPDPDRTQPADKRLALHAPGVQTREDQAEHRKDQTGPDRTSK